MIMRYSNVRGNINVTHVDLKYTIHIGGNINVTYIYRLQVQEEISTLHIRVDFKGRRENKLHT